MKPTWKRMSVWTPAVLALAVLATGPVAGDDSGVKVGWKDGKTTVEFSKAKISLSNRVQIRYTYQNPEDPEAPSRGSFRTRRAKTKFEGWIYNPALTFKLQMNWPDQNPIEDAYVDYDVTGGDKVFRIRGGQYKVPFGRQELTSSGKQQFVDRSIVSGEFAKGRDFGLQIHGIAANGQFSWAAGAFNGTGRTGKDADTDGESGDEFLVKENDNNKLQTNARVVYQPFGDIEYSESDFESKDRPLFAVGAGYERNSRHGTTDGNDILRKVVGVDTSFKFKGLSIFAEYFDRTNELEVIDDVDGDGTLDDDDFGSDGLHAQIGYFIIPKKLEVALRYASIDPNDAVSSDDLTERGIALNWFWNKHNLKLQADYRILEDDAESRESDEEKEARVQVQFIF